MKKLQSFILREIAGESILVPTGQTTLEFNGMISLSDTAAFIWKNLEDVEDLHDLVAMLCKEYEIDQATALDDSKEFIQELVATGMAGYSDPDKEW